MIYKYTSILGVLRLAVVVARKREVKLHIVKKKKKKERKGLLYPIPLNPFSFSSQVWLFVLCSSAQTFFSTFKPNVLILGRYFAFFTLQQIFEILIDFVLINGL